MYCKMCGKVIFEKRLQQGKDTCSYSCAFKSWQQLEQWFNSIKAFNKENS